MRSFVFSLTVVLLVAISVLSANGTPAASPEIDKGAKDMVLEGGKSGKVPFPHHKHQENLEDCQACHELFPQQKGAIEQLKAAGELKKKRVMNKLCVKCHKKLKRSGQVSGPTTCKTCHHKSLKS